jgi:hypothetical protein
MYPHCLQIMVPALLARPQAGFALSGSRYWSGGPCPILSTPRMSYQREFLGYGMFMYGPACALFRTDVFRTLGGFDNHGVASDLVFWLKACAKVSVLLLPGDLFWYRVHEGQELQSDRASRDAALASAHVWRTLLAPECPLDPEEREIARCNYAYTMAGEVWRTLRRRRWSHARFLLRSYPLTAADWFHYLRRPRRSALAGTPLDAHGEFVVRRWDGDMAHTSQVK